MKLVLYDLYHKIKSLRSYKPIALNFLALSTVQLTNFIVPILSFPYLIKILGSSNFGIVSYGLTIMLYFNTFTDYGFNLSSTREVSMKQGDVKQLSIIFCNVLATKAILFLISIIILLILIILLPKFQKESELFLIGIIYIFGNAIMPVWYFQGIEKMNHLTVANLISKIILITLIYLIIKSPQDYKYVLGIYGSANLISGIYGIYIAYSKYGLLVVLPKWKNIFNNLRDGWSMLISNLSIIGFSSSNIIILSFFVSDKIIGNYSIAEKIIFALWQILSVFSQATFPYVCKLIQSNFLEVKKYIRNIYLPFNLFVLMMCICLFTYAEQIVFWTTNSLERQTIDLLKLMSPVIYIVCLNIPAYQILLAKNLKRQYAIIFNSATFINLLACPILVRVYGVNGAALSLLLIQILVTCSLHTVLEIKMGKYSIWRKQTNIQSL
ncbi:oligosaccharide flippase family protein [Spirosoma radiotolerans]|uniref:Polysaccharide biosynthesis protein n=1 Tax=Spirosoma radiotolerans TaxID=1379870 RepID=A0A0E3ZRF3_9BACT|nr:oligosaccharide flippase family protein [Spirosoma radiotolerans]AKD53610.1 hypothetical protein SD10_00520 [Spirosoma radiotolerans]